MRKIRNLFSLAVIFALVISSVSLKAQVPEQGQDQQPEIEVSDSELENFANIMQESQKVQKEAQGVVVKAIEDNPDLEMKRYQEISQAQQQGEEVDMTDEEEEAYSAVQKVVEEEQQKMDKKMTAILEDYEMTEERYMEINKALRTDKELQKRLEEFMPQQQEQVPQQQ
ncbi:MAG: DUF4168 domain-containing protein [Bacteroidales bacterium]